MKYVLAALLALLLAVFQASALPYVKVLGVTPDLLLIFAACWAAVRGQGEAMVVVPLAGLMRDLTSSDPIGTSVLALAPLVPLAALRELPVVESQFLPALAMVAAGSLAYAVIAMGVMAASGEGVPWLTALLYVAIPAAIVNALFAIIIYLPIRWLSLDLRPRGPRLSPGATL